MNDDIVYHYCSTSTFREIIKTGSIRLSDILKSNDSMEIRWIAKYFDEVFRSQLLKYLEIKYFSERYDANSLVDLFSQYIDVFFYKGLSGEGLLYKYYVACFSMERDLLSQWRGYADDGRGFAVGFDKNVLAKQETEGYKFLTPITGKVVYNDTRQKAIVNQAIGSLFEDLKKLAKSGGNIDDLRKAYQDCFLRLMKEAVFMKNPFFSEEREWRTAVWSYVDDERNNKGIIVVQDGKTENYKIEYKIKDDIFVSCFDLHYSPETIKEVILGPKNRSEISDIETFLKLKGIDCSVVKSDGTYI